MIIPRAENAVIVLSSIADHDDRPALRQKRIKPLERWLARFDASADLNTWLARLEQLHPTEIDMASAAEFRSGQRAWGFLRPAAAGVHVTGTNGKGSTCAALEKTAQHAGLRYWAVSPSALARVQRTLSVLLAECIR